MATSYEKRKGKTQHSLTCKIINSSSRLMVYTAILSPPSISLIATGTLDENTKRSLYFKSHNAARVHSDLLGNGRT